MVPLGFFSGGSPFVVIYRCWFVMFQWAQLIKESISLSQFLSMSSPNNVLVMFTFCSILTQMTQMMSFYSSGSLHDLSHILLSSKKGLVCGIHHSGLHDLSCNIKCHITPSLDVTKWLQNESVTNRVDHTMFILARLVSPFPLSLHHTTNLWIAQYNLWLDEYIMLYITATKLRFWSF